MHEKIKEIALQAGGSHYPTVGGKNLEKFAELFLGECTNWINDNVGMISTEARQDLYEHFGFDVNLGENYGNNRKT